MRGQCFFAPMWKILPSGFESHPFLCWIFKKFKNRTFQKKRKFRNEKKTNFYKTAKNEGALLVFFAGKIFHWDFQKIKHCGRNNLNFDELPRREKIAVFASRTIIYYYCTSYCTTVYCTGAYCTRTKNCDFRPKNRKFWNPFWSKFLHVTFFWTTKFLEYLQNIFWSSDSILKLNYEERWTTLKPPF